jgi:hypothetical protein
MAWEDYSVLEYITKTHAVQHEEREEHECALWILDLDNPLFSRVCSL